MVLCCATVPHASVGIIEAFGKFVGLARPGFNCLNCCCGQTIAGYVSLKVQQLDVSCETKTNDNVFVNIVVSVQYQVLQENIYEAYYKLTNPRAQITSYVFDVVRAEVPKLELDRVFDTKDEIARAVKAELQKVFVS